MYRIAWVSKSTNHSSHGEYCLTYEEAHEYATIYNKEHRDIYHWPEGNS